MERISSHLPPKWSHLQVFFSTDEGSQYLPATEEDDVEEQLVYQLWEDFARVASKLLDRIENSSSLPLLSPET